MERRHDHFGAVVLQNYDTLEQVLLSSRRTRWRGGHRAARGVGQPLDERVQAGCARNGAGGADDGLASRDLHERGWMTTSRSSMCCRFASTCAYVSGGATCSLSV